MVMALAAHPEWDVRSWKGTVHFRLFARHDGTAGAGYWYETKEEELNGKS
jgi:hypothetical protein